MPDPEPECGVVASDTDNDEHGSALCGADPGDDCDDSVDTVYEGAPELCDRLDNDCDELTDLFDGLVVNEDIKELGDSASDYRYIGDVAWSEEKQVFGLVWREGELDGSSVMFMAVAPDGTVKVAAKAIDAGHLLADAGVSAVQYRPRIAAGDGGFGVTWTVPGAVAFREVPANGVVNSAVKELATDATLPRPDVAFSEASQTWGLAWGNLGATISANGTASTPVVVVNGVANRLAALDNGFVFVGASGIFLTPADLSETKELPLLGVNPIYPAVAATANRFGVVSTPNPSTAPVGAQPSFTAYDAEGNKLCGPVDVAASKLLVTDVVAIASGYILNLDYRYGFQEIGLDCQVGTLLVKDTGEDTNYLSAFDGSDSHGYLVTALNPDEVPEYRLLGNNFCN